MAQTLFSGKGFGHMKTKKTLSNQAQCYLLLALPIIGFLSFTLYPILWAVSKSFFYYTGAAVVTRFTGLENFTSLLSDTGYWSSWIFTLKFTGWKMLFEIPGALILAVMIGRLSKGAGFFRASYYMPNMISIAIVGVIFTNLFDFFGFINALLKSVNIAPVDWFSQTNSATFVLVLGSIWASFGINVLYFSAAIANVPNALYEAAEIDGAGPVVKFFHVTIPMILPVFQTILLLAINGTLHVSEYILAVTNGAPGGTTNTVGSYLVLNFLPGFVSIMSLPTAPNLGYGSAMAIANSVIYGGIAVIYMKLTKKMNEGY